ncbi:SHOCT domain-containing protein [Leucobacter triazinivorans]|uniref:SHOCT domain-containing protein n=1 Tax=Leucobacter triazinivorans TaxID=1784719 RepID=A0A4P6KFB1_9MICO|nr:SHOCT domain-containing protein [Leucobacter triazinivorans]QBE48933.1 SHOCT domain-containing protein [Leucobacter triazinivorans]
MPIRRIGRPGLLGLAARTAVVAGTASAVSGGMANARQRRTQAEFEQQQYEAAQQQAQVDEAARNAAAQLATPPASAPASAPGAPAAPAGESIADQLQQLASLMQAGVLSADEFAAAKAKLLS